MPQCVEDNYDHVSPPESVHISSDMSINTFCDDTKLYRRGYDSAWLIQVHGTIDGDLDSSE